MNATSPAIVAQSAVRRLPRLALLSLCIVYVLAGFVGRAPWKSDDITALGYMLELAHGHTPWMSPLMGGLPPETDGLLPYWLGAWMLMLAPAHWSGETMSRLPFMAMLMGTLLATWYGVYHLARSPRAQPVAFAFGGEAHPVDYARALADGGLLALLACLGLAQLAHETTSHVTQLFATSLMFYGVAASPYRRWLPLLAIGAGQGILLLSGGPTMAILLGLGSAWVMRMQPAPDESSSPSPHRTAVAVVMTSVVAAGVVGLLDLARWRMNTPDDWAQWHDIGRLLIWFAWPAWPLALWSLWRWRQQLKGRHWPLHLALPLWFAVLPLLATLTTQPADRALLLSLPAMATLAALALPTLSRNLSALIDWFTLLFFSAAGLLIWVIWIAMQTGVPQQPAANVARLAPGFVPSFSWGPFALAVVVTLVWGRVVMWRIGRHPAVIWKSLVLPAGGTVLGWVLLMTLWLPLLDHARGYEAMVTSARRTLGPAPCAEMLGLSRAQMAAFLHHGQMRLYPLGTPNQCEWLLVSRDPAKSRQASDATQGWQLRARVWRLADRREVVQIYQRIPLAPNSPHE